MDKKQEGMLRLTQNLNMLLQMSNVKNLDVDTLRNPEEICDALEHTSIEDFLDYVNEQVIMIMELFEDSKSDEYNHPLIENKLAGLEEENERLLTQLESVLNKPAAEQNDAFDIIKGIIEMRETIYSRIDWAEENREDSSIKILNTHLKETAKILQSAGVAIYDEADDFDSSICTVVDTIETEDDELADKIAKVFRPGYEYKGEMLKSKEVIIYVKRVE